MRRGIAALGVLAAATALAACNNGTTPSSTSSDSASNDALFLLCWSGGPPPSATCYMVTVIRWILFLQQFSQLCASCYICRETAALGHPKER